MKKLFFLTAIVSLLLVGCNNDNGDYDPNDPSRETVRLLPSRISFDGGGGIDLQYDDLNRLVRLVSWGDTTVITYDANNNPVRMEGNNVAVTFLYEGKQVFIAGQRWSSLISDTLTLNANGQVVKRVSWSYNTWDGWRRSSQEEFFYNLTGNVVRIMENNYHQILYSYSNVRSVFRHVNAPDWFIFSVISLEIRYPSDDCVPCQTFYHSRIGYMMSSIREQYRNEGVLNYELDANGYVVRATLEWEERLVGGGTRTERKSWSYEYVLAR